MKSKNHKAITAFESAHLARVKELSKSDRELFWLRAFFKTIKALFVAGKIKVVP